jgi:methionyl-tRNA synthetase
VLHTTIETVRRVAILCQPFMPDSARKLLDLLAVPADSRSFTEVDEAHALEAGAALPAPTGVFPRYVEAAAEV